MDNTSLFESFSIALLASIVVFFLMGTCLSFAWPAFHRRQARLNPRQYSRAVFGYTALPLTISMAVLVSCSAVPIAAGFNIIPAHCHIELVAGVCSPHEPPSFAGLWFGLLVTLVGALFLGLATLTSYRLFVHSQLCQKLDLCCAFDARLDAWVLDTDRAVAFCVGIFRRRVIISRGLIQRLDISQLDIVLNHERRHAKRFDGIGMFMLQIMTVPFLARSKKGLTDEFMLSAEFECDRYAAEQCGDGFAVADTLVKLGRIQLSENRTSSEGNFAFSVFGQSIERRVTWLIDMPETCEQGLSETIERLIFYTIVVAFVMAEPIHQALEKALGYIPS